MDKTEETVKKMIEVKKLRPWVKFAAFSITGIFIFSVFNTFVYKPNPHIVQFDLKRIQAMKERPLDNKE